MLYIESTTEALHHEAAEICTQRIEAAVRAAGVCTLHGHRIPTDLASPNAAAQAYEDIMRRVCRTPPGYLPRFDVVLLGMGADGHTASLFPGNDALEERHRLTHAVQTETSQVSRITLTLPVLNGAEVVLFLVSGSDKAGIMQQIWQEAPLTPS